MTCIRAEICQVFLPTILLDMGFTAIHSQGLTAPPFFLSFIVTIVSTYVADRIRQRGYMIMFLSTIGGIGYILLATCRPVGVRYFGVSSSFSYRRSGLITLSRYSLQLPASFHPVSLLVLLSPLRFPLTNPKTDTYIFIVANILPWVLSKPSQSFPTHTVNHLN